MDGANGGAGQGPGQGADNVKFTFNEVVAFLKEDDPVLRSCQGYLRGKNQLNEAINKERKALEEDLSKLVEQRAQTAIKIEEEQVAIATRDKTLSALTEENDRLSKLREQATAQIEEARQARDKTLSNLREEEAALREKTERLSTLKEQTAAKIKEEEEAIATRDNRLSNFKKETAARDKAVLQLRDERTELDNRLSELGKRRAEAAEELRMLEEASEDRVEACRKEQQKTAQANDKMREVEQGLESLEDLFAGPLSSLRKGVQDLQRKLGTGPSGCKGSDTETASERENAASARKSPPRSLRRRLRKSNKALEVPLPPSQGQGQGPPERRGRGRPPKIKGQGDISAAAASGPASKKRKVDLGRERPSFSQGRRHSKESETRTLEIDLVDLVEDEETLEGMNIERTLGTETPTTATATDVADSEEKTLIGTETSSNDRNDLEEETLEGQDGTLETETSAMYVVHPEEKTLEWMYVDETVGTETSATANDLFVLTKKTLEGVNRTLETETSANDVVDPEEDEETLEGMNRTLETVTSTAELELELELEAMFAENDDEAGKVKGPTPNVSQGQGQGQGQEEQTPRTCAYCFTPILLSEGNSKVLHPCEKCKRRVYCSKECQTADWTPYPEQKGKGNQDIDGKHYEYGQGHATWCGEPYGEEGLDWDIFPTGEEAGLELFEVGLKARRDFEPGERIFVGGIRKHQNLSGRNWGKIVQMSADESGANASFLTTFDYPGRYNVRILIAEKAIRKNEEIFVPQFPSQSCEEALSIYSREVGWKAIADVEARKMPALPGKEAVIRILSEELQETSPLLLERAYEDAVTAARQDCNYGFVKSRTELKYNFGRTIKYLRTRIDLVQHLVHPNDPKLTYLREMAENLFDWWKKLEQESKM